MAKSVTIDELIEYVDENPGVTRVELMKGLKINHPQMIEHLLAGVDNGDLHLMKVLRSNHIFTDIKVAEEFKARKLANQIRPDQPRSGENTAIEKAVIELNKTVDKLWRPTK